MNITTRIKNLSVPKGKIDVVIDTDTYNEIDDQFAVSYLLKSSYKVNTVAIYAAPFFNKNSTSPKDGMEKSHLEILKLLDLLDMSSKSEIVYKGADCYLQDENSPVISPAAENLVKLAKGYTPENPLYIVALAAITNIASALIMAPEIKDNIVVVWLGGHSLESSNPASEFNMVQDIAAARVVMKSKAPFVQLPCNGVASSFTISKPELEYWLVEKNKISDFLAKNTIKEADSYAKGTPWTRPIWDVTAAAWLLNENDRFMSSRLIPTYLPEYDNLYSENKDGELMRYVYLIKRDALMKDLIDTLTL